MTSNKRNQAALSRMRKRVEAEKARRWLREQVKTNKIRVEVAEEEEFVAASI